MIKFYLDNQPDSSNQANIIVRCDANKLLSVHFSLAEIVCQSTPILQSRGAEKYIAISLLKRKHAEVKKV